MHKSFTVISISIIFLCSKLHCKETHSQTKAKTNFYKYFLRIGYSYLRIVNCFLTIIIGY